jgi:thiamine biosynthesis protein ThiS
MANAECRIGPAVQSTAVTITLNGDAHSLAGPTTVAGLLAELEIDPRSVAVERNFVVIKRDAYAATPVEEGDQIEIVNFVGGG